MVKQIYNIFVMKVVILKMITRMMILGAITCLEKNKRNIMKLFEI